MYTASKKRAIAHRQYMNAHGDGRCAMLAKMYNSVAWKYARLAKLHSNPVDELSLLEHHVEDAQDVHHILKFQDQTDEVTRWQLLTDPDNLISLSSHTHQMLHRYPSSLTQAQHDELERRKERIIAKYMSLGMQISYTTDYNSK